MIDTIKNILSSIWTDQLKEYFISTTFCSERHFQAEFYRHLTTELGKISPDFKVFVEPRIELEIGRSLYRYDKRPDLVIVYQQQLLSFIELKYQIKSSALWEKDIDTLRKFATGIKKKNTKIYAKLEEIGEEPYTLNSEILCCFAVITKESASAMQSNIWHKFPTENWLHLKGIIGRKQVAFVVKSINSETA
jgi:hypothetical protein